MGYLLSILKKTNYRYIITGLRSLLFDGWVQDCSISSANVLEILHSCTQPLIWWVGEVKFCTEFELWMCLVNRIHGQLFWSVQFDVARAWRIRPSLHCLRGQETTCYSFWVSMQPCGIPKQSCWVSQNFRYMFLRYFIYPWKLSL